MRWLAGICVCSAAALWLAAPSTSAAPPAPKPEVEKAATEKKPEPDKKAEPTKKGEPGKRAEPEKIRLEREVREIEGWKVHLDKRLLEPAHAELLAKATRTLAYKLNEITLIVPAPAVEKLRAVGIVLDLNHGKLKPMQYHPSPGWLRDNGYDPAIARMVHIPVAADLAGKMPVNGQPMVILHELSHAYHDQVFGFDDKRIKDAWIAFRDSGKYTKVLHITGRQEKHYALTNQMEFFAEMSEAYFGTNDFFPFVRGELRNELPDLYKLLGEVWGVQK